MKNSFSLLQKAGQVVFFFFLIIISINAQEVEKVYITLSPATTMMSVNGDTISIEKNNQSYVLELEKGIYPVELWAQGYELVRDTLVVKETINNKYANKYAKALMIKTPEFEAFEKLNISYGREIKVKERKKVALIAINTLLTYYVIAGGRFRIKKYEIRANDAYGRYISSITESRLEEEFNIYKQAEKKHNKTVKYYKNKLIVGVPLLIGAYIGTWIQIKKINRKPLSEKPIFNPKNSFLGSDIKLGVESLGGNYKVGLRITF